MQTMIAPSHVILIVIDGLRADALPIASTPEIDRLTARGSVTMTAQSVMPSVTLPCHVSLFYGALPAHHGVTSNTWQTPRTPETGLLQLAHQAGLDTASFYTWEPLRDLAPPGILDMAYLRSLGEPEDNRVYEIADAAAQYLAHSPGALAFVYLEAPDQAGHRFGWMSKRYLDAVTKCDRAISTIVAALEQAGSLAETVILVTSDHGGHDTRHGTDNPEDLTVPWIIAGPGIRGGHSIRENIDITATAPTLLHLLGIKIPADWTGTVPLEILVPETG